MPSVLYSTRCLIGNENLRLRIYVDDETIRPTSDEFTPVDIPIDFIRPSSTRLHFDFLEKSSENIPKDLPIRFLLNVEQTTSNSKRKRDVQFDETSTRSTNASTTPIIGTSIDSTVSSKSFFHRVFSLKTLKSFSTEKNFLRIDFVDVSNEIHWKIRSLTLELETEDLAFELLTNLNLCLSTLKHRPRRLLAFVNPFSGKGRARLVFDKKVLPIFTRTNVSVRTIYTERANEARDYLLHQPLDEFDGLICVGGDGMFAELCHGLLLRTTIEANVDIDDPNGNLVQPNLRIGIIPAGSTDAVVFGTTGLNDPVTSALQIIVGESLCIDITTVHNENGFVRFMATMLAYGFFGDIIHQSDRWRCLGPLRYDLAGFFQFIRNKSYHSELSITISNSTTGDDTTLEQSPDLEQLLDIETTPKISTPFCRRNCDQCADGNSLSNSTEIRREGHYTTINCLNMPCRCAKSKYGMSPFVHLGDGTFDLLLVKRSWRTGFLRFLWQVANDGRSIGDLPNVERFRVSDVRIRPLTREGKRPGHWSCDGELIRGNEIRIRVHRQALNLFASGIQFKDENKTKNSSCCFCCFSKRKDED